MFLRRLFRFLVAFPAFYVVVSALRAGEARSSTWMLALVAIVVALAGARAPEGTDAGVARTRLWTAMGLSVAIASAALTTRPVWAALARELAAFVAMLGAVRAVRGIEGDVGLAPKASEASAPLGSGALAIHRSTLVVVGFACGLAALVDVASFFTPGGDDTAPFVAVVAGTIALFAVGLAALLTARVRRLELVVPPRALVCCGSAGVGLIAALALALSDAVAPDAAVVLGSAIASAMIVRVARTRDALALARHGRRALTLVVFGGPLAALSAIAVEGRMGGAGGIALALTALALLVGAISPKLEEPFLPVKGILLDAFREARAAATERESREAMADALVRIREACAVGLGPTAAPSPELWLLHPTRVLTVNAAGYLQERSAELPEGIFDIALGEPYGTLRTTVLRALEVRRADLRPVLAWLDHRDAMFATVISERAESDAPDGLLVVPAGARTEPVTLEEVRAAKEFADAFVAVTQATSAKARHLGRERGLRDRIDALDDELERVRHTVDVEVGRHVLAAMRLARPATVGIASAASRMAYEALERRVLQNAPVRIVARAGIDPVPYIARAHLGGPRGDGPLVVVDGTSTREHDLARWTDERTSPLALADRGLLVLVDGASLPREVQLLVARAAAERRPPWERGAVLDFELALTTTQPDADLCIELEARFEGAPPIELPGLRDRPEDLHSIVADRLAREGLRVLGRPIGIESAAFARLVEHPFPGEDAELAAIVTRLVARVSGDVVRAADVDALGIIEAPVESHERHGS